MSARRLQVLVCGLALQLLLAGAALAQAVAPASPEAMAREALGAEPGWSSVAVWRAGQLSQAMVRREAVTAPVQPVPVSGPAALFEIGSVSKLFTGLLLAQAVERGELALDATLGQLLDGQLVFDSPRVAAITLRQLVTHTSCLPRQFGGVRFGPPVLAQIRDTDRAGLLAALARQQLDAAAPCPARYSNYGFALLGTVLSDRLGQPWEALVRTRIAAPLGLRDTLQHLGTNADRLVPAWFGEAVAEPWTMDAFAGAGALRASAQDLVLFGRALLAGRGGPLGAAAERMLTPLAAYQGREIGYAVQIHGPPQRRTYAHDGLTGGYRSWLALAADSGEVVAALVGNGQAPLSRMAQAWWAARYPVDDAAIVLDGALLRPLAGVYRLDDDVPVMVATDGAKLFVRARGGVFRAYQAVAPDTFTRSAGGARITFRRDAAGAVDALVLEQAGGRRVAQRLAQPAPEAEILPAGRAQDYEGRYRVARRSAPAIVFTVHAQDGQLMVRSSLYPWEPVFPLSGATDRFRYDLPDAQLRFERDADGRVVALVLHQRGELRALRIDEKR